MNSNCWPTHCWFSTAIRFLTGSEEALAGVEQEISRVSLHGGIRELADLCVVKAVPVRADRVLAERRVVAIVQKTRVVLQQTPQALKTEDSLFLLMSKGRNWQSFLFAFGKDGREDSRPSLAYRKEY